MRHPLGEHRFQAGDRVRVLTCKAWGDAVAIQTWAARWDKHWWYGRVVQVEHMGPDSDAPLTEVLVQWDPHSRPRGKPRWREYRGVRYDCGDFETSLDGPKLPGGQWPTDVERKRWSTFAVVPEGLRAYNHPGRGRGGGRVTQEEAEGDEGGDGEGVGSG